MPPRMPKPIKPVDLVYFFFMPDFLATFFVADLAFRFTAVAVLFIFFFALPKDLGMAFVILGTFAPATPPTTAPTAAPIGPTKAPVAAPAAAPPTIPAPDNESPFFAADFFAIGCFPSVCVESSRRAYSNPDGNGQR
jgi:hypothetical protein